MSVKSISTKKKKKVVIPRRPKTGLGAVPLDDRRGWEGIKYYFHYELDKKDIAKCIKDYVSKTYTKQEAKLIGYNPEYKFYMFTHYAAVAFLLEKDYDFEGKLEVYPPALKKYCDSLLESGRELEAEKLAEAAEKAKLANVVVLTPQQRLARKVNETIMEDLDELEDAWIAGEKPTIELYDLMKKYDLKGMAVPLISPWLESRLLEYRDAYDKNCEQAVEGYSHIGRREIKRRITDIERMLSDLESFKQAAKAQRSVRKPKPKSAEKIVAKLKFKKEDTEFKLASINPVSIVDSHVLYVFNTKYKQLTKYVTTSVKGFEVSGTTIKNFDADQSIKITLRKPGDMLPIVLKKTPNQIEKAIDNLTTKPSVPNGRINADCILLRVV